MASYSNLCEISGTEITNSSGSESARRLCLTSGPGAPVDLIRGTGVQINAPLMARYGYDDALAPNASSETGFSFHLRTKLNLDTLTDGQLLFQSNESNFSRNYHRFAIIIKEDDDGFHTVLRYDYPNVDIDGMSIADDYVELTGPVITDALTHYTFVVDRAEMFDENDNQTVRDRFKYYVNQDVPVTHVYERAVDNDPTSFIFSDENSITGSSAYGFLIPTPQLMPGEENPAPEARLDLAIFAHAVLDEELIDLLQSDQPPEYCVTSTTELTADVNNIPSLEGTTFSYENMGVEATIEGESAGEIYRTIVFDIPSEITSRFDLEFTGGNVYQASDFRRYYFSYDPGEENPNQITVTADYNNPSFTPPGQEAVFTFTFDLYDAQEDVIYTRSVNYKPTINVQLPAPPEDLSEGGPDKIPMRYFSNIQSSPNAVLGTDIPRGSLYPRQTLQYGGLGQPAIGVSEQVVIAPCYIEFEVTTSSGVYTGSVGEREVAVGLNNAGVAVNGKYYNTFFTNPTDIGSQEGVTIYFPSREIVQNGILLGFLPGSNRRVGIAWDMNVILLTDTEGNWFENEAPTTNPAIQPNSSNIYYRYNCAQLVGQVFNASAMVTLLAPQHYANSKYPYLTQGIPGVYGLGSDLNLMGDIGTANWFDASGQVSWEGAVTPSVIEAEPNGRGHKKAYLVGPSQYLKTAAYVEHTLDQMTPTTTFAWQYPMSLIEFEIVPLRDLELGEIMDISSNSYPGNANPTDHPWFDIWVWRCDDASRPTWYNRHIFFFGENPVLMTGPNGVLPNPGDVRNPLGFTTIANQSFVLSIVKLPNGYVALGLNSTSTDPVRNWTVPSNAYYNPPYQMKIGFGRRRGTSSPNFHLCGMRASVGVPLLEYGSSDPSPYLLNAILEVNTSDIKHLSVVSDLGYHTADNTVSPATYTFAEWTDWGADTFAFVSHTNSNVYFVQTPAPTDRKQKILNIYRIAGGATTAPGTVETLQYSVDLSPLGGVDTATYGGASTYFSQQTRNAGYSPADNCFYTNIIYSDGNLNQYGNNNSGTQCVVAVNVGTGVATVVEQYAPPPPYSPSNIYCTPSQTYWTGNAVANISVGIRNGIDYAIGPGNFDTYAMPNTLIVRTANTNHYATPTIVDPTDGKVKRLRLMNVAVDDVGMIYYIGLLYKTIASNPFVGNGPNPWSAVAPTNQNWFIGKVSAAAVIAGTAIFNTTVIQPWASGYSDDENMFDLVLSTDKDGVEDLIWAINAYSGSLVNPAADNNDWIIVIDKTTFDIKRKVMSSQTWSYDSRLTVNALPGATNKFVGYYGAGHYIPPGGHAYEYSVDNFQTMHGLDPIDIDYGNGMVFGFADLPYPTS